VEVADMKRQFSTSFPELSASPSKWNRRFRLFALW